MEIFRSNNPTDLIHWQHLVTLYKLSIKTTGEVKSVSIFMIMTETFVEVGININKKYNACMNKFFLKNIKHKKTILKLVLQTTTSGSRGYKVVRKVYGVTCP